MMQMEVEDPELFELEAAVKALLMVSARAVDSAAAQSVNTLVESGQSAVKVQQGGIQLEAVAVTIP